MLRSCAENYELNHGLLEAVSTGRAGQTNYSRERQLLPTDPPDEAESLRALGTDCDGEGHEGDTNSDSAVMESAPGEIRIDQTLFFS